MTEREIIGLIKSHMNGWQQVNRTEAQCERELLDLANTLIKSFEKGRPSTSLTPTPHNVASIIVEEMSRWTATHADFEAIAGRLIRYFAVYYAQPVQHSGLPGNPIVAGELALGRRSSAKRALMTSATGIVLPT